MPADEVAKTIILTVSNQKVELNVVNTEEWRDTHSEMFQCS